MFVCERCGGSFKATAVTSASCPRCSAEGVPDALMKFRLFGGSALAVAGIDPRRTGQASGRAMPAEESAGDGARRTA